MCIPIFGLPSPARHCHVVSPAHWAIFFWCVDTHRPGCLGQEPLPSAGHTWGFSWVQQHPLGAAELSPAQLLVSGVLGVPAVGEIVVCTWGPRGSPKQCRYGPRFNRWKLQILSPAATYFQHKHYYSLQTLQLSLPRPHWPYLSIWPSCPWNDFSPGVFLHPSFGQTFGESCTSVCQTCLALHQPSSRGFQASVGPKFRYFYFMWERVSCISYSEAYWLRMPYIWFTVTCNKISFDV